MKEKATRWRQELGTAFKDGKTIFIYLSEFVEVFVATGSVDYSGSGRNRVTTRHVVPLDNFKLLPFGLDNVTIARGREMKPASKLGVLVSYWADFGAASQYEVYFDSKGVTPLIVTKTGNKTVGGVISSKPGSGGGAIFYLPPVKFDQAEFTEQKDGKTYWTKSGLTFGRKWISALTAIDATVAAETQQTPEPDWVKTTQFQLQSESAIQSRIAEATARLERLEAEKRALEDELQREGSLRHLLYETGAVLEAAILEALKVLGVDATGFKEADSEFDVVFTWKGARYLGEVEGKDSKAINVDKISQLERNLSEDFAREDVNEYAHGILFGNAFRLQELATRGEFFTMKCRSTAERIKAALVRTPDLFFVARYVRESGDADFAHKCIAAIAAADGSVVQFPDVPKPDTTIVVETAAK